MHDFWITVSIIIALFALISLYRGIAGPTLYDRIISVGIIGTKTVIILCLIGFFYGRPEMFIDISLVYALLNFVIALAIAKYIQNIHKV
ncbi:monovalent cation/H+ antiporter complex subunit F [Planctomycetota bacterium]